MKKSQKILCLTLVFVLLTAALSGCGDKKTSDNGKVTLKWMNNVAIDSDSEVEKFLEERYNVEIDTISVTSNYTDKLGAMLASNEVPDVFMVNEPDMWIPLAKQGLIASIDMDMVKEYAPDYYKSIVDFDENLFKICQVNKKTYALSKVTGDEYNTSAIWRKDWLDKVGITKTPETIEEFEEAFTKMRNDDPDGNGKKDTYGMSAMGNHLQRFFDVIFGAYGVMPGQWSVDKNGKVSCDALSDKAKEALITLNRWYEKELIHPEFITDDVSTLSSKFDNGVVAVKFAGATGATGFTSAGKSFRDGWAKRNPNASFEIGTIPIGPDGDRGDWLWGNRSNFVCFGKQLEDNPEAMQAALRILNDTICNDEVALKVYYGDKGVTYDITDNGADYIGDYAADAAKRAEYGVGTFFNMLKPLATWAVPEVANKYMSSKLVTFMEENAKWGGIKDDLYRPVLDSSSIYQADLDKIRLVAYSEFITGARSFDKWDEFVDEYMDKGGKVLLEEAQEYYDTVLK